MNKCLVLFVEGDTEVEFYKAVISDAKQRRPNQRFDIMIETKNIKVKWEDVEMEFRETGATVVHIMARQSIEDWFLIDLEGIITFLRLPKKTKISGKNGYDKLKNLYKRANKIYYKGMKSNGMIDKLNIFKIVTAVKDQLKPLYEILGVDWI